VAGIRNNGDYPLNGKESLEGAKTPVLDIWGDGSSNDTGAGPEHEAWFLIHIDKPRYQMPII